jgi:hypothetical protein
VKGVLNLAFNERFLILPFPLKAKETKTLKRSLRFLWANYTVAVSLEFNVLADGKSEEIGTSFLEFRRIQVNRMHSQV